MEETGTLWEVALQILPGPSHTPLPPHPKTRGKKAQKARQHADAERQWKNFTKCTTHDNPSPHPTPPHPQGGCWCAPLSNPFSHRAPAVPLAPGPTGDPCHSGELG